MDSYNLVFLFSLFSYLCLIVINMNTHSKHENFIGNVDDVTQSYFRLYSNKDDSSEGG